jgi:hypothetical protein
MAAETINKSHFEKNVWQDCAQFSKRRGKSKPREPEENYLPGYNQKHVGKR